MANIAGADQVQQQLTNQFLGVKNKVSGMFGDVIAQACSAYERKYHERMPVAKQQMLIQAFNYFGEHPPTQGVTREMILSAAQDIAKVDNPLSFMMAMMSIIIPNFAYTEVVGIQNMPTKESPIFIPQISATQARNGFNPGDSLLGATNWAAADNYTTNQFTAPATVAQVGTAAPYTYTLTLTIPAGTVPGTVLVSARGFAIGGVASPLSFQDDTKGGFLPDPYLASSSVSIPYIAGGSVVLSLDASVQLATVIANASATLFSTSDPDAIPGNNIIQTFDTTNGYEIQHPYGVQNPAQVTLEWNTIPCVAIPYRVRSQYSLDNYYAAKQVLAGYDIDAVMATSLAGLINKEISGNVFNKMLNDSDALYTWNSTPPTGVSWAIHRLSILELMVAAKNGIRQNIQRSGGNIAVVGTGLINHIETLDSTIYTPQKYSSEPIGPYVHGTFSNGIKVIKNQAAGWADRGFMSYKSSEVDASYIGGTYIALYSTPSLVLDTLKSVQGMGCQAGFVKVFENSIVELGISGNWQLP
jgi:hypothetical protein